MLAVIIFASIWMVNKKMGIEGWKAFVPIYNVYTWCKAVFGTGWLFLLLFVPLVNLVFAIVYLVSIIKCFHLKGWFIVGTIFASPIFEIIIAFNDSQFKDITVSNDDLVTKAVFKIKTFINSDANNTSLSTFDDLPNL